ncbi:O-antigen ligase family protein [Mucilaginibacter agri]|uniref:O-antigen ligase-related domain-containing protein n=1 Tax=Mucilaginibacter agri TaxID=2695265 RepID=A0A965ZJ18_9SPHI|nr:O-antigen ligase family protein [Mucilaginibacter agri]NCD70551.1 hypothetical protein [Mucilaginibacter agri]
MFFPDNYGRASGLYINPNYAGFVCLIGYCGSLGLQNHYVKRTGQFLFSFLGLLTFSRTFILIWVILNLIHASVNLKNIKGLVIGVVAIIGILSFAKTFNLNGLRFSQFQDVLDSKSKIADLNQDSRTDTWAKYYDKILDSPISGNGFGALRGIDQGEGVHNSYLLILGEAGIVPFMVFTIYFIFMIFKSWKFLKTKIHLLFANIAIAMFLLTSHNFFNNYIILLSCIWAYNKSYLQSDIDNEEIEVKVEVLYDGVLPKTFSR